MLNQQVLRAEIVDILGIINIVNIADVADIGMDIADIGTDITDIAMGIMDIVDSADITDWMLRTLQWKQVDAYKVSRGCPVIQLSLSLNFFFNLLCSFFKYLDD